MLSPEVAQQLLLHEAWTAPGSSHLDLGCVKLDLLDPAILTSEGPDDPASLEALWLRALGIFVSSKSHFSLPHLTFLKQGGVTDGKGLPVLSLC